MQPRVAGGYEWKDSERVMNYLEREKEPDREATFREAHERMLGLLPAAPEEAFQFLDLGAGAGAVSASIMRRFRNAHGVLADISAPMMQAGGEQLAPFTGRYSYVEYDMNADDWPAGMAGPFKAIVSARAIHHLTNERKLALFRRIHGALATGGAFLNWDLFREPDRPIRDSHPDDRTAATIDDQLDLLRQAGFSGVAHSHIVGRRAIFFGRRP
jgi:cyclopropane fatty-acyl-phospholipid synthase-like methyltransferase